MQSRTLILMAGFVLLSILDVSHFSSRLPESIAIHFDLHGNPNGWASPKTAFALDIGLTLFMALTFLGIRALIFHLPPQMINMPNRDYWLAPERREASLRQIASLLDAIGVSTLAFLRIVMHDVYTSAATTPPAGLKYTTPALVLYLGIIGLFVVRSITRFSKTKSTSI